MRLRVRDKKESRDSKKKRKVKSGIELEAVKWNLRQGKKRVRLFFKYKILLVRRRVQDFRLYGEEHRTKDARYLEYGKPREGEQIET